AQPCQGWGREFESRFPLQNSKNPDRKIRVFYCLRKIKRTIKTGLPNEILNNGEFSVREILEHSV
ncbi:hypothetical protein ACVCFZ_13155, partial [Acinetobacter variabilis]